MDVQNKAVFLSGFNHSRDFRIAELGGVYGEYGSLFDCVDKFLFCHRTIFLQR